MSSSSTSVGRGPAHGSNENHDCDPLHKTLGEAAPQDAPPAGAELLDAAAPASPAGVAGGPPRPGVGKGAQSYPDGPNVESSPREAEAARGHVPTERSR